MSEGKVKCKTSHGTANLPQNTGLPVVNYNLKINKKLYAALCDEADQRGVNISDIMLGLLAAGLGKPELGFMPKKKMGRPRKVREPQPA